MVYWIVLTDFSKEYIDVTIGEHQWLVLTWAMLCWVPGSAELSSSPDMVLAVSWASGQQAAARGVKIKLSVAVN